MIEDVTSELARQLRNIILLAMLFGACVGGIFALALYEVLS